MRSEAARETYGTYHLTNTVPLHEQTFLRGMPWLSKYMPRPTNARHLMPDPANEPDFYRMSTLFPLAGDAQIVGRTEPAPTKTPPAPECLPAPVAANTVTHADFSRVLNPTQAFRHAGTTPARLVLPPHSSILAQPHLNLTSTLLHRQHLLNQAAALEGQANLERNALFKAALSGNLGLNDSNFLRGFPF